MEMDTSVILTLESDRESTVDKLTVYEADGLVLNPVIWKNTPANLMEMVFNRLPFASLMRFRMLSKDWNSLITSPKFAQDCRRQVSPKPMPTVFCNARQSGKRHVSVNILNSKTNSWVPLQMPPNKATQGDSFSFIACTGGLMCFITTNRRHFVVCNPVTGAFRRFEVPFPAGKDTEYLGHGKYIFTGLLVDHDAGTFKLVVVNLAAALERRTLLYNSTDRSWRSGAPVLGCDWHPSHPFWEVVDVFTSKESVYCLLSLNVRLVEVFRAEFPTCQCAVLKYDILNDRWLETYLGTRRVVSRHHALKLVEYQSQMLLVTRATVPRANTVVFKIEEAVDGHKMELVGDHFGFPDVEMAYFGRTAIDDTSPICWAGDVKYSIPDDSESEDDFIMVEKFNCSTRESSVLPPLSVSYDIEVFSEIVLLEPSIPVDL